MPRVTEGVILEPGLQLEAAGFHMCGQTSKLDFLQVYFLEFQNSEMEKMVNLRR